MKWYKHISDSLDDPFIFSLMDEFGSDGYLVFFGILEIYAREFRTEDGWKLTEKFSFFRHKLHISSSKLEKILSKIWKWEIEYDGNMISIFIPKFRELMDESTLKKLREVEKPSGTIPESFQKSAVQTKTKTKTKTETKTKNKEYSDDFLAFYNSYPKRVGRDDAWKAWQKRNGDRPPLESIIAAVNTQKESSQWQKDNGQYIPNPATWINQGRWADEVESHPLAGQVSDTTLHNINVLKNWSPKNAE